MSDSKALILNSSGDLAEVLVDSLVDKPAITTASAATVDLYNVTSNTVFITGTTTITSFGTPPVDGAKRLVQFIGSLTLTHGTGGGQIRLPGLANITTSSGDMAEFISSGGVWICYNYTKLNGQSVVGGGGSDDGVTASNICDLAMDGTSILNSYNPYYYKKDIGAAKLVHIGQSAFDDAAFFGTNSSSSIASGTGAANTPVLGEISQSTGTTATGYARAGYELASSGTVTAFSPYNTILGLTGIDAKLAASLCHHVSALSNATNTYTSVVTLLGDGPATNTAISATTMGICLSYTHSVNSGNYVITYRGSDGALTTVNTTVAPGVGIANAKRIIAKAHRTAAGVSTITVSIGGTVYTITDSSFNANGSYIRPALGYRIVKSAGTTSVSQGIRHASVARNFL